MSGFSGIVRFESTPETAEADRAAIACMAEAIAFRGPDAQHQWQYGGASFAFSLLTTGPAPQSPAQPVTLDGQTFFLGEARLDRRKELIESLIQLGERCASDATDEEIVLRVWKLAREAGVNRILLDELHGDYSFALWEPSRRELNCFRDFMGGRPFYYCASNEALSFSNTLRAIHHAPGFTGELDGEFIGDFLLNSWCPRPTHTVYRFIRRLPAGHWLTFSTTGLQIRRFQQLPVEEPLFLKHDAEYVEIYRELLERAVADRVPRGPAVIFLSGGMDSTTVAATACGLRKKRGIPTQLQAICVDLRPLFADEEGIIAERAAAHLGIEFELFQRGNSLPFANFSELSARLPEPVADPFWETYASLCRRASERSRVILTGYGGDNVLNNETWPYLIYLAKRGRFVRALTEFGGYTIRNNALPPLRAGIRTRLRKWFGKPGPTPNYPGWLAPEFEAQFDLRNRWDELWRKPHLVHPVHPFAYFTLTDAFWSCVQDKEEAAGPGLAMDKRAPLLDYRLLKFLFRLPAMPWCANKELMRRAMQGILPDVIVHRAKRPLAEEPLFLHIKNKNWHPAQVKALSPQIEEFVNWQVLLKQSEHLENATFSEQWSKVPPVALNFWLSTLKSH